jgi:hypothetical protein
MSSLPMPLKNILFFFFFLLCTKPPNIISVQGLKNNIFKNNFFLQHITKLQAGMNEA